MKTVLKYLKPHIVFAVLAPLFMFIEVMCDLFQPRLMSGIVDIGIANGDMGYILKTGFQMVGLALIGMVGGVGCTVFASKASQYFGRDLREAMFKNVQDFSFHNLDSFHTSSLITRLTNDITQVQNIVLMSLRMLVRSPLLFIGGIMMVVTLDSALAVVLLVSIPIMFLLIIFILRKAFPLFGIVQKKIDKLNTVLRENMAGVRVVKAFVRAAEEKAKFKAANEELKDTNLKAFRIVTVSMPVMMFIMNATTLAVIWFGGLRIENGYLQTGELMAFINYLVQILMALMMLSMGIVQVTRGKASIDRVSEVLATESDIVSPEKTVTPKKNEGVIEFRNVTFAYPGSTADPVLKNISFTANKGETVGILGQTGAGKSSLVCLIPRLYDVTEGEILINGVDIRQRNLDELRKEIGMSPQQSVLFSGSIKDNIKWGNPNATDEEIIEAAKISQAFEFVDALPDKFETQLGQMGVNLSGGQKQRLSIARAIVKKPATLIFDDSTSAVDMATEAKLQSAIKNSLQDVTKIIIAQRISSIKAADKIIVLAGGEIAAMGTHDSLLGTNEIYTEIYRSQSLDGGVIIHE